jgi:hypothetical protein
MSFARPILCILLPLAACSTPQPSKDARTDASASSAPEKFDAKPAVAQAAAPADHAACIYADGKEPAPGCPHGVAEPDAPQHSDGHFGAPFQLAQAVPLADAIGKAAVEPVLVKGTVDAVCQKKGCWMVIRDGAESARVLMKDHGFAVPMDSRGKTALVEGTLQPRTFSEAQVKHIAQDAGENPAGVSGERREWVLSASGVKIEPQT